jgi:hypothetical protein
MRHGLYPLRPSRALTIDLIIQTGTKPLANIATLASYPMMSCIIMC